MKSESEYSDIANIQHKQQNERDANIGVKMFRVCRENFDGYGEGRGRAERDQTGAKAARKWTTDRLFMFLDTSFDLLGALLFSFESLELFFTLDDLERVPGVELSLPESLACDRARSHGCGGGRKEMFAGMKKSPEVTKIITKFAS